MLIRNCVLAALCVLAVPAFASPANPDAMVPDPAPFPSLLNDPAPSRQHHEHNASHDHAAPAQSASSGESTLGESTPHQHHHGHDHQHHSQQEMTP